MNQDQKNRITAIAIQRLISRFAEIVKEDREAEVRAIGIYRLPVYPTAENNQQL